jgi:signal transduction histidine kinase
MKAHGGTKASRNHATGAHERSGTLVATSRRLPSSLTVSVVIVLAVVSVVGFVLTKRNTDQQEQALLQSNTGQAAAYASEIFTGNAATLTSAAAEVTSTNGSPTAFEKAEAVPAPLVLLLVKKTGADYVVAAGSGSGFQPGQTLQGDALSTVAHAGAKYGAGPVTFNGKLSTARFAIGAPTVPTGLVIYEQFSLDPFTATPVTTGKPFVKLKAALYGAGPVSTHNLLVSTGPLPLSGSMARASVAVGTSQWTLVAVARSPFIGGFARSSSVIVLVLGLLLALLVAIAIEALVRRERYAEALVRERTEELTKSHAAFVRRERLSAVGEMATVIGHELRNPLGAAINLIYLARNRVADRDDPELNDYLDRAERETNRAAALCEDLTSYMRERLPVFVDLNVGAMVAQVLESTPPPPGIEVSVEGNGIGVRADRAQLVQMLTNVIANAYEAMPDGGSLGIVSSENDDFVEITMEDTGVGIDPTVIERLTEPFFTTKPVGTGLGLAIVQRYAGGHGGNIAIEGGTERGARVTIRLPRVTSEVTP